MGAPGLVPPHGLRAGVLRLSEDEFLLLEWPVGPRVLPAGLTKAEREIAELLLAGLSSSEIARLRRTSARTVEHQVASVFSKLGVGSRSELFAAVRRARTAAGTEP